MNYAEIPIRDGTVALVDLQDEEIARKFSWGFQVRGVASYTKDQTILLHTLISPYEATSFINGNKRDCRRDNLIPFVKHGREGMNIWHDEKTCSYEVYRYVTPIGMKRIAYRSRVGYSIKRSQATAERLAQDMAKELMSIPRDEFIDFLFERNTKARNGSDILLDWDCFDGRERTEMEFAMENTSSKYALIE